MSNLLADQPSAYLKSAAHQPVHWYPWGDAAFAAAKAGDKPILLDIGAVWCHWCHVMDHESYESPAVAEVLNRDFVCIKVDRDERPDVDSRYQRAVQALTGQGGWPLTAFLTGEGEVFFGGTYFPPEDNPYGRPGFLAVLRQVARAYRAEREKIAGNADVIRRHVVETLDETKPGTVSAELVKQAANDMSRIFDIRFGGFGTSPKFPHPAAVRFLLTRWYDERLPWMKDIAEKTLTGMARGGIRDHLGGGFHRYSVDERWIVPHFEKMSYDNSELLHAYLDGYAALGTPLCKEVAQGIVDWVRATLSDGTGAFYASQDADVGPTDDGDYWTWTPEEFKQALPEKAFPVASRVFEVEAQGEMHHNPEKNVLWWASDPANDDERRQLADAITTLKAARDKRPAPYVDTTPYVNWNAMMASAFLHAGAVLDRPDCNTLALAVLGRIWTESWNEQTGVGHVLGRPEPRGLLDDNVQGAAAFLDAFEATGDTAWLDRARAVLAYCVRAHWDETAGGFFDLAATNGAAAAYLATRAKPIQDSPTPSGNGVAALVLARLWGLTDEAEWRRLLDRQLAAFAGTAPQLSLHGATLFCAADWALYPITRVEVGGPAGEGAACSMHLLALQTYRPRKVVVRKIAPAPAATVCIGTACSLPVATPQALANLL
jgi:hypothetical protein